MANLTDASKANESGQNLEYRLMSFLCEKNIPFKQQKPGQPEIDFIVNGEIYVDCTNQNSEGSVQEKIPHKIWKYYKKYRYKNVYIIRGSKIPDNTVIEHCNDIADRYNFKWHLVSFEEFCTFITHEKIKNKLEEFFT
jgi:hypothetical protein